MWMQGRFNFKVTSQDNSGKLLVSGALINEDGAEMIRFEELTVNPGDTISLGPIQVEVTCDSSWTVEAAPEGKAANTSKVTESAKANATPGLHAKR